MVVSITLTENARNKLGIIAAILCAILSLAGICLICVGIFIQVHISDELILLESYNSGLLPHFIVSIGTLLFLINGVTVKLAYDSGFASTCEKFRLVLVPLLIVMFLFIWVILAAGIVTLSHRTDVEEALHDGLRDAMKRYKNNLPVKVAIDHLQMRTRCCGSRNFEDWFEVGWINTDYVDKTDVIVKSKMKDGDIYVEDVPFSCCDVRVHRPCVTHSVFETSAHRNYEPVTLYRRGCTDILMDEFENRILHPTGSAVMVLFGAQTFVLILLRYLQTSVQSAYEEGNPEGPGAGFLCPNICCASCTTGDPKKYQEGALRSIRGEDPGLDSTADDSMMTEGMTSEGPGHFGNDPYMGREGAGAFGEPKEGHSKGRNKSDNSKSKRKSKSPKRSKSPKKSKKSKSPKRLKSPKRSKSPKRASSKKKRKM